MWKCDANVILKYFIYKTENVRWRRNAHHFSMAIFAHNYQI